jgi:beta-phosphoglucomutase
VIRAFVFDLDGTLVETEEVKALSYARAATELRPDLNEGEVVAAFGDLVGLSRQEVAVGLMRRFELEDAARARMAEFGVGTPWQAYVQIRLGIYEEMLGDPKLIQEHRYPHNIALLRSVRQEGFPTALATQSHREQARRVLGILGLEDEFDVVVTRDDVEHGKPDPEMHLLAARELDFEAGECLAIEDSPAGVQGALAAGMEVIAVSLHKVSMNAGYARVSRKNQRRERRGAGREPGCRLRGGDGGPATRRAALARRALRARGRRRADRASLEVAGAVKGARTAG